MPIDHRRLPVPTESKSPYAIANNAEIPVELISSNGLRHDGRSLETVRPLFLRAGVISQANGSAYVEMDKTKLICAVYGPREVTRRENFSMQGQLNCEFKYATFSCARRRQHMVDSEEKDIATLLYQALSPAVILEKFPKSRMDIFVTVLQDDGSVLAAAINAASVALSDAGIEMYDMVVGCSLRQKEGTVLLDPSGPEEYKHRVEEVVSNDGCITLGFMPSLHQVAALIQSGELDSQVAINGIKVLTEACQRMFPVLQQCMVRSVKTRIQPAIKS